MKKVVQCSSKEFVMVADFCELIDSYKYIGFQAKDGDRYMIVVAGPDAGLAVNPSGTWADWTAQVKEDLSSYVVFDTKEDLLDWMKG